MSHTVDARRMRELLEQLRSAAFTDRRLPDLVLGAMYRHFRFIEFDSTSGGPFWPVLKGLMCLSEDDHVNLVVLEPDPIKYFFAQFQSYGALRFDLSTSSDDYYEALSTGPTVSPADALLYNSEVVVWFPDSLKWIIWGERSVGLAVVGTRVDLNLPIETIIREAGFPVFSVDQALLDLVSPNFREAEALEVFSRRLEQNYWVGIA